MILKELAIASNPIEFVREHKADVLKAKRNLAIKHSDAILNVASTYRNKSLSTKQEQEGALDVSIVGSTMNYMDSHFDVLLNGCYNKTLSDNPASSFKFLKDHIHSYTGVIGKFTGATTEQIPLKELGLDQEGKAEALVFNAQVLKDYDSKMYDMYKSGAVDQHSVGIKYVNIKFADSDPDHKDDFAVWEKYIDNIINREEVEKAGFFFAVQEVKLLECSAVLFGANPLTPTRKSAVKHDTPNYMTRLALNHN